MKRILLSLILALSCISGYAVSAAQDIQNPIIESIEVLTPKVEQGGTVKISVKVSDDLAGVQKISVRFAATQTGLTFFTRVDESSPLTGEYILEADLNKYAELGVWGAIQADVTDFAEKNSYYDTVGAGADPTPLLGVSFEVVEKLEVEDKPQTNDDGFKSLESMTDVIANKEFAIKFNMDVAIKTLTERNIYVQDQQGNKVPLMFIIDRKANKSSSDVTIAPLSDYKSKSTYTLYIKDIYSTAGKKLKQNTKMAFTIR